MKDAVPFVIIIAILAVSAFYSRRFRNQKAKRLAGLRSWAKTRGLSFQEDADFSFESEYPLARLGQENNRYAFNTMRGTVKCRSVCAFDYHYGVYVPAKNGWEMVDGYFSAVVVKTELPLKPLFIRSETLSEKVHDLLGGEHVALESAEFNEQFHVTSPDRRWAFDALPQQTMEFLLESPRFALEIKNGCILAYRERLFSAKEFDAALGVVLGFLDRIPASVVKELANQ